MTGPEVSYCERWDHVAHTPMDPLTEEQARERYEHGPWFTVVLPSAGRPGEADTLLEVEAGLTTVTAVFFDDDTGGELANFVFRRHGDELFFAEAVEYTAPEDGRRGRTAVVEVEQLWVRPDGTFAAASDTRDGDAGYGEGRLDPATHREPVPAFGDWAGLARYER